MSQWKIFYTDGLSLKSSKYDPCDIPPAKRIGVHSILQMIDDGRVRECIEQYHYIFSIRDDKWIGVGVDGLFDYMINDFENLSCIMNGRTMATDRFWNVKKAVSEDKEMPGGIPHFSNVVGPGGGAEYDPTKENWTELTGHFY